TISNVTTGVETKEHDRLEGKERTRIYDDVQNVGVISSGKTTYIEADKYVSRGAVTESGGTTYIEANDVNINTIALKDYERTEENHGYDLYRTTEKLGSEVTGLDNVIINAGNDINIKGSTVASDGTVQLTAGNDINIENDKNTMYTESKRDKKGTFSSYSKEERSYQEGAVASTIIGNNVILDAGNDANIKASNVIAVKNDDVQSSGGNIIVTAGNDINITTDDMNNEYYLKEKKSGWSASASMSGGGASAGVTYSSTSLENTRNSTTVATSSIVSEGSTLLSAGNKVRTEAMQANVGEDMIIRGTNGVELLDAQEVYEEKVKQKSTSIGVSVNVAFTPAQMVSTVSDVISNSKDYGFGNTSQSINTIGNGIQDLRNVTQLGGNLYDGIRYGSQYLNGHMNNGVMENAKQEALSNLVSASVTASYSQSKYESNTSGTNSVAGNINVGKNFILQSDGDVKLVNQKVTVGDNFVVDAKNFEARAGENTYSNDTKSSSSGINVGYDIVNNHVIGGANISGGKSNTDSKYYDNTTINVGGTFQLTTKEDATFAGANVIADKINFDIGKDLNIISLQDEYKSNGSSYGVGVDVSGKMPGSNKEEGYAIPSLNGSYSQDNADSKWVNNQTSILAENGGSVKVGETLTNTGAVIGSLNPNEKLSIDANKVVVENLKDHDKGENSGMSFSGVSKDTLIPQIGIQYGSHDKQQDSNATFVNTEVTEAGKRLDLEELGINTDINKAQKITKDEVVEQIDTVIHTDMGNKAVRDSFMEDILKTGALVPEIVQGIREGMTNEGETVLGQISNNMGERSDDIKAFIEGRDQKLQEQLDKNKNKDGKIALNEGTEKLIEDNLRKTLEEFGKGGYEIVYVVDDSNISMSIDDKHGVMYVNVNGDGFGNAEEMRKNVQHESGHGTYKDGTIDKTATEKMGNKDKVLTPSNVVIDDSVIEKLKEGTDAYDIARENGELRDRYHSGKEDLREFHLLPNGKLDLDYFRSVYGSTQEAIRDWEYAMKNGTKEALIEYVKSEIIDEVKGKIIDEVPFGKWISRGLDVYNIIGGKKPKSQQEDLVLDYAWDKKKLLQKTSDLIVYNSQKEIISLMETIAKKEIGENNLNSQAGINRMKDLKDEIRIEFENNPSATYSKYKSSFDYAISKNKANFTLNDYYDMKKDVDGYFNLGSRENLTGYKERGDSDYFFETGKFQFKNGKAKNYMNKMAEFSIK
ncbi:hemagglutinin repeat-containing protein, partial [Sebaldella sp. S0638]|uniref:hemagglutinin repeat-containing protein n=1 Tax=Sebaldella sp. S0638 TaxID=2957809 RepID=UPI00209F7E66